MQSLSVNLMRSTHQTYIVYTHQAVSLFSNYFILFVTHNNYYAHLVCTFYNIIIIYQYYYSLVFLYHVYRTNDCNMILYYR